MKAFMKTDSPVIARINVTPIIDVALVLVIVLLITAPMISASDLDVDLPEAKTRSVEDEVRIAITMSKDGKIAVDEDVINPKALIPLLSQRVAKENDEILVIIRADAEVPHALVRHVLSETRTAGIKRVAIATRQPGKVDR